METVRLYGKTVNTWTAIEEFVEWDGKREEREVITQREIEYIEYNLDGTVHHTGTEDFSSDRHRLIDNAWIYTWNGHDRNKGGYRKFEDRGMIRYNVLENKNVKRLLVAKYPDAEIIQIR